MWGAAHLVRLAPALAAGAKAAAAGILGLLERRRIRRIRRELAATIGSIVLQHRDPPCALRRERGALYHLVLPVVLGQELGKLGQRVAAELLHLLGERACRRVSERRPLGSGRSRTPAFGCVGRSRSAVPPPQPQSRARVLFLAARTQRKPRTPNVPRGAAGRRLPTEAHRRTECCCCLNASLQHAAGLSTTGEVLFAQPAEHVCSLVHARELWCWEGTRTCTQILPQILGTSSCARRNCSRSLL